MYRIALKMLMGDRAKYLGIIMGLTFASLLITQQMAIFVGPIIRTYGTLSDVGLPDIWVMNIRTDIDENDAWRFSDGAKVIAYVCGNPKLHVDLKFVRIEPYVVPKKSLTGDTTERVDTRVPQILYGFPHEALNVYVGQQMDVYIEAPDISGKIASAVVESTTGPKSAAD